MRLEYVSRSKIVLVRFLILLTVMVFLISCETMFLSPPIQGYSGAKRSSIEISRVQFGSLLDHRVDNWKITIDKINLPPASQGLDLLPGKHKLYLRFEEARPYGEGDCSKACPGFGECFHWECSALLELYQCEGTFETVAGMDLVIAVTTGQEYVDHRAANFRKNITKYMTKSIPDETNKAIPCRRIGRSTRAKSYYDSYPPSRW